MPKIVWLDAATMGKTADLSPVLECGEVRLYQTTCKDEILERVKGAQIAITNKVPFDEETMKNSSLKLICATATGLNHIDLEAAKRLGIVVKNVAGYSTKSVAQHAVGLVLTLAGRLGFFDEYTKNKEGWAKSPIFTHTERVPAEIDGKKWLIVGMGDIGRATAAIASALGAQVCWHSTSGVDRDEFLNGEKLKRLDSTKEFAKCDIITIHAPFNKNTDNLFSRELLGSLKPGTILVNVARGGIVDEAAASELVEGGRLYFGTDVLKTEPMAKDNPFLGVKNKEHFIITPHVAWASSEAIARLIALTAKNIRDFLEGE